jgi:hypothetical protein
MAPRPWTAAFVEIAREHREHECSVAGPAQALEALPQLPMSRLGHAGVHARAAAPPLQG